MPQRFASIPSTRVHLGEFLRQADEISDGALDQASSQVRELIAMTLVQATTRLRQPRPAAPVSLIPESLR